MRPLLLTAAITQGARSAITDELGYTIVDRAGTQHASAIRDGAAAGVIGWLLEGDPCGEAELSALPDLQWIACVRGGPVNVDIPAATRRGIPVLFAPGRNAAAVADFVVGQIVCARPPHRADQPPDAHGLLTEEREGRDPRRKDVIWRPQDPTAPIPYHVFRGRELSTLTLGLLGLGRVGELVAAHGRALGMRVVAHDPYVLGPLDDIRLVELDELLAVSDVLSLHARGKRDARRCRRAARAPARLVRGQHCPGHDPGLSGARRGAAGRAPRAGRPSTSSRTSRCCRDDPLLGLDNVVLTPHIAGASTNVIDHYSSTIVDTLRALQRGDDPSNLAVANREVLVRWSLGLT